MVLPAPRRVKGQGGPLKAPKIAGPMNKQRRVGRPMAGAEPRVKISPTVAQESIAIFDAITDATGESRGQIIDRLLLREAKRTKLQPLVPDRQQRRAGADAKARGRLG
jgi:hypothetical protein